MDKNCNRRIKGVYFIFVLLFLVISAKIFYLQVFKSNFFKNLARNQHYRLLSLKGKRGEIFDSRGRILATSVGRYSVFTDPLLIKNPESTASLLSTKLNLSKEFLLSKLKQKNRFGWLKRKISLEDRDKLRVLKIKGIGFIREEERFYPQESLSSSLIGIVDIDNNGLEGLELFYNDYLNGKDGWVQVLQDSSSQEIILSPHIVIPKSGANLILTIDAQIQYWAEKYLVEKVKEFNAEGGSVVVMNASTGGIYALANYPDFNPNEFKPSDLSNLKNKALCDIFEPGSVFKIVALIAAVNEGKYKDSDIIFCEKGSFKVPGTTLHDWRPYGNLTFREVFMKSSNIGVAKIVASLGSKIYYKYLDLYQFGQVTGIDFPGETAGMIKPLNNWSKTSQYIIPIGQEIGVNLIQLALVFANVVNDGFLVQPHLVQSVCFDNFCKDIPFVKKRVLSVESASRVKDILIDVVNSGTGAQAKIEGRKIGGKTGTAQKYDPQIKRYSPTDYRATFVGFIADLEPAVVIGVTIDKPKKSHFGGVVAAPVFKNIAEKVIKYLD
ncbi:MAG: penicillin-binding protein 2 [Candidatus Omnitrophica bacterium]|nr:penicillin-binding protein 2 [Candidatus Omnitrophota bacterium]